MNNESIKGKFSVGYDRQCVTPEIGTWLGGYGNGKDRPSIGKMWEDDDLWISAVCMTDTEDNSIIAMTIDLCRMPLGGYRELRELINKETGIPIQNVMIASTHSHSTPEYIDGEPAMAKFRIQFLEQGLAAAKNALADRAPAEAYMGIRKVEALNFVRRYMKEGKFIGTNHSGGDAHETPADNDLQMLKFTREGKKDIVIVNWGAHPDHSKEIGGASGTPEFHRGCSADYIYPLRKTVEANADCHFAFYQGAAGNLNPISLIKEECYRIHGRMEKDNVPRVIAYGRELADEVLALYNSPLTKIELGKANGAESKILANRPKGPEKGSHEYNMYYAVAVVTWANRTLNEPTPESKQAADWLVEKFELGDSENIEKLVADEQNPLHTHAVCVKVLREGGKVPGTNESTRNCAIHMAKMFGFKSGPYAANQILTRTANMEKPPFDMPLYAVSCGDIAFVGTPGESFDTNGMEVKEGSPFKMTFFCEHCGGAWGYFPSKLAWGNGGYEVESTSEAEGTAEQMTEELINMLNGMKAKQ